MIPPWALGALLAGGGAQAADFTVSPDAQQTITWSGYVENQATLMALPHRDAEDAEDTGGSGLDLLDYNKLRLELEARPQPGFSANANIVARSWHGTTSMDLADLLPERFDNDLALLALFDPDATQYQFQNEIAINDAYFTARQGRFKLRMGKQQFRFGSGWFWNPTDPFTVKDLLDPSYEKQGVTAARLQLNLPLQGLLEAWALPRQTWGDFQVEDSALAFRARVAPGQWVFTASQASLRDLAALDLSATDMDAFMVQGRRHIFGLDVAGEVGGVGLWLEGAYNRMHLDDWTDLEPIAQQAWYEVEAGTSYTIRGGTTFMAEYLYNERGASYSDDYTLWRWLLYMDQTLRTLGQHYGTATVQVPLGRLHTDLAVSAIANLSDGSWLLNPWVSYDWGQNLEISLYGALGFGGDEGEMSSFGQAGTLRARFSF